MSSNNIFDLVLFDLDGTLVDFQWNLQEGIAEILKVIENAGIDTAHYGVSPDYAELYNKTPKNIEHLGEQKKKILLNKMNLIYEKYDMDALSRWTPYSETQSMLERISDAGIRMGIVSNCCAKAVNTVLAKYNLLRFFELSLSRNDVPYLKPSPEGLKIALEHFAVSPERALFVGDSVNDVLAANQVPMKSCLLMTGENVVTGKGGQAGTYQIASLDKLVMLVQ